jgi:hypothetical protein
MSGREKVLLCPNFTLSKEIVPLSVFLAAPRCCALVSVPCRSAVAGVVTGNLPYRHR